jgi:hypothetical protein
LQALQDRQSNNRANPTALSPASLSELLTKAGGKTITAEMILADIANGAPANGDGTISLIQYTAWLAKHAAP